MKTQIGKKLKDAEMYAPLILIKTMLEEHSQFQDKGDFQGLRGDCMCLTS